MLIFTISLGMRVAGSFDAAYDATVFLLQGVVVHMDKAAMDVLRTFVEQSIRFQWLSVFLVAWTSRRIFIALFGALETAFEVPGRGFAGGNLLAFLMVVITGAAQLLTLALTTLRATLEGTLERYTGAIPHAGDFVHQLLDLALTLVMPVLITMTFFFMVYRIVPRRVVNNRDAFRGALLATLLWEGAKWAFAYYVRNLAHYAGLYGTLEALIVLALWLELSVSIILYCGEVVALLIKTRTPAEAILD